MAWDDPEMGRDRRAGEAPDLPGGLASAGMGIIPGRRFGAAVKRLTLELEEGLPFGRILDLDVWVREGPVGRGDLGLPPRRCLLCGEEAKICARLGGHSFEALRAEAARLLALTSPSTRG
jgi:phosphoribosyl-dephospho-CoA transferase